MFNHQSKLPRKGRKVLEAMWRQFINRRHYVNDREYLNSTILVSTAPTLARLKPATLIQLSNSGRSLKQIWGEHHEHFLTTILPHIGMDCCELAVSKNCISLLFYKEAILKKWLHLPDVRFFLSQPEKDFTTIDRSITSIQLQMKYDFPHEIGAILGYPADDVRAFIENKGRNFLLNGYWKVYYHPVSAIHIFKLYDRAKVKVIEYFISKWDKLRI